MTKDTKVVNVDNITDVDNPTVKEIQNAVDSSNDGDTIVIKGSPTDNGEIKSDKVLTIKGEDCTFNKIRWISAKDISFENITFKKSNSDYGGAIKSDGSLNLTNCNFDENSADTEGGAVWAKKNVIVNNCSFNKNKCSGAKVSQCNGGAIYSTSTYTLWIYYSEFINNKAYVSGGAIYGGPCMSHCSLVNNSCSGAKVSLCEGGAIYDTTGGVQFNYCNFTGNVAEDYGGAIYSDTSVIAIDSSFENNSAKDRGGAIYADNYVKIQNSNFTNNWATSGGAIYVDDYGVDISNSSFVNNSADVSGGAIWANEAVSVDHCSFNNNSANYGINPQCDGVRLIYSNFTNNFAYHYGGAVWSDDGVAVQNCIFKNNSVTDNHGGAIYMDDSCDLRVSHSAFYNNHANERVVLSIVKVIVLIFT